jgi:deoxycytidylate deaminase
MKFPRLNPFYQASLILVAAAVILVAVAILTDRRDLTSAALVISALVCLITGIFLALLSSSEPLDSRYMSLLPVQGCINLCSVCADLGISGNACMLPAGKNGRTRTMQFIPVAGYNGSPAEGDSFVTGQDIAGLVTVPNGEPLSREIRERDHLVIPHGLADTLVVVQEVAEGVLEIADHVTAETDGAVITVKMEGYRLVSGCRAVAAESPRCCTTNPCPVCSLFACLLAEGTGSVVQVERCSPDADVPAVTAVFTLFP